MIKNEIKSFIFYMLIIAALLASCASTVQVSEDLSPAEIIQRGQEALDRNRYNVAIQYYHALYERNQSNIDLVITAEYHIASIHYKQGKYEQAKTEFNNLLNYYNTPDEELLPQHFKKLAQIVLQRIEDKENSNSKK